MINRYEPDFKIDNINYDDEKVYEMISEGHTQGVFQFESAGMTNTIVRLKPTVLEDLIAVISLYRPGPMQFIDTYIENSHNPQKVTYRHPLLSNILDVTYGCIVYQEQVMQIFRELAGYTLGRADIVRRAMSKKKFDVLEKEKQDFILGCKANGVEENISQAIFNEIENFAAYAFNKSHAAAYAVVAYQTAYMKCYYPREYLAALMTSVLGSSGKLISYIEECARLDIKVLPPSVNFSEKSFTVSQNNIRYGLLAIKNLGSAVIDRMILERKTYGDFLSFESFCRRMLGKDLNKRAIESLIKAGALDNLGNNRREMFFNMSSIIDGLENEKRKNIEGQIGFFNMIEETKSTSSISKMDDYTDKQKLSMEKEVTGMYLSGHPMSAFKKYYDSGDIARIDRIIEASQGENDFYKDEQRVDLIAVVSSFKKKLTRNGENMAFVLVEDMYASMEVIVFPKILEKYSSLVQENMELKIHGRLSFTEDKEPKLICEYLVEAKEENIGKAKENSKSGLYIKILEDDLYDKAIKYIEIFGGDTDLYVYYDKSKKLMKAPSKYRLDPNEVLLKELKNILGEENVVIKK